MKNQSTGIWPIPTWPTYDPLTTQSTVAVVNKAGSDMDTFFDSWHCNGWKLSRWKYAKSFGSYTHQSYEYNFIQFLHGWSLHVLSFLLSADWVYPVYPAGLLFVYVWYMIGILQPFTAVELIYGIYHDIHIYNHLHNHSTTMFYLCMIYDTNVLRNSRSHFLSG